MSLHRVDFTGQARKPTPESDDSETAISEALAALSPWFGVAELFLELDLDGVQALARDLAFATARLALTSRSRATVAAEVRHAAWEVGLERDADCLLVSVYRPGAQPEVWQTARRVSLERAGASLLRAAEHLAAARPSPTPGGDRVGPASARGLSLARQQLARALGRPAKQSPRHVARVEVHSRRRGRLRISATVELRQQPETPDRSAELLRTDLHALLLLGDWRAQVARSDCRLRQTHVFLLAEQLVALAADALDARQSSRGMLRRLRAGNCTVGLRVDDCGNAHLLVAESRGSPRRLPPVSIDDFVHSVVSFSRELARAIVRADRSQGTNLRLSALQTAVQRLAGRVRPAGAERSLVNCAPESYRAFAEVDEAKTPLPPVSGVGRLRFTESWRAVVGGIDLRSIVLCGDRLVVGSNHELACLERTMGLVLWRHPAERAASIMTPRGLVRLAPDGALHIHSLDDGEVETSLQLEPCVGAATSGAVVNAPSLPPMLLVGDGSRHLVALDLDSGEIRWRRAVRRRGPLRLRRAGKLMVLAAGEPEVQAFDLLTGETVWRRCGALRNCARPVIDQGALFSLAVEAGQGPRTALLERVDVWSGATVWSRPVPRPVRVVGAPQVSADAVLLVTEDDGCLGLMAFEQDTGQLRFDHKGGLVRGAAACLVVDDTVIASGEAGQLVAVSAGDGSLRYRHVFASWSSRAHIADRPQSYQPILRSGALFIPQSEVYVVGPRDGSVLGTIPCDLVPDLLRVDERCGVYVAEASGHLAAYAAQPTLRLVSPVTP